MKMQSLDVVDDNMAYIAKRWPECLTEAEDENGKLRKVIDFDKLRQVLSTDAISDKQERYLFTWPDKRHAIRMANTPTNSTLRPVVNDETTPTGKDSKGNKYCSSGSVDFDNTQNLYIEGDNLEVLKLLRESYLGKVKMIYVDPPYNTGGDFVYRDNFIKKNSDYADISGAYDAEGNQLVNEFDKNADSNGRFHTDWLNMIYPRLKVARDLLSEDGVIFISIDDHEVHNLRKVCDEVFGGSNFVEEFVWVKKKKGSHLSKTHRSMTEYVMCYAKNSGFLELFGEMAYADKQQPLAKRTNAVKTLSFPSNCIHANLADGLYKEGKYGTGSSALYFSDFEVKGGNVSNKLIVSGPFIWRQDKLDEEIKKGSTIYLSSKFGFNVLRADQSDKIKRPSSLIDSSIGVGTNEDAYAEIQYIFQHEAIMSYPKPSSLILYLTKSATFFHPNSLILDFFSGSSTTAHAVMQLNAEDGGNRKYIMVQLPETTDEKSEAHKAGYKNICEIGKERIRRAGKKIKEDHPEWKGDTGFRVLKVDTSNMEDVYYTPSKTVMQSLFADNIKADRTDKDLLFQVMMELGIPLSEKIKKTEIQGKTVWNVGDGFLVACFESNVTEEAIATIAKLRPQYFVIADRSLANDDVADNLEQLFEEYSPATNRKIL